MHRFVTAFAFLLVGSTFLFADHHKQFIEVRTYHAKSAEAAKSLDSYLNTALIPALGRISAAPVGAFREEQDQPEPIRIVVVAHKTLGDFAASASKLASDDGYQKAAAEYMAFTKKDSPLVRIRSELLHSFDCWPALKKPDAAGKDGRLYELRVYESTNERLGDLKVEMFNAGEVPIFLDSGVVPVFMGQALVGDLMPNLTYMTVYENQAAKDQAWKNFVKHPDWKVLSGMEKYKGTVSKIHKINLVPMTGSQL